MRKRTRIGSILLALAMLLTLLPATAMATAVTVTDAAGLIAAAETGGEIVLGADITLTERLTVKADTVLDLNGHKLVSICDDFYGLYCAYNSETEFLPSLVVKDSAGGGEFSSSTVKCLINTNNFTMHSGTITLNYQGDSTVTAVTCKDLIMDGGTVQVTSTTNNATALYVGGDIGISGSARIEAHSDRYAISLSANGGNGQTASFSGNASLVGCVSISAYESITFDKNVSVVVPQCSDSDSSYAIKIDRSNLTINGGYFEAVNRSMLTAQYGVSSSYGTAVINGGTFYLNSTASHDMGAFWYISGGLTINGGVFKTDAENIAFSASWNAGGKVNINGGYFNKPLLGHLSEGVTATFPTPSGYAFSSDTLGALTGSAGDYADYYWITKSAQVTYDVNHETSDGDTQNYTGTAYTTYSASSMKATDSPSTYTAYNSSVPFRADGALFKGWAADGAAERGGTSVSGLSANDTLYAIWDTESSPSYDIVYDRNGGTGTTPAGETGKVVNDSIIAQAQGDLARANYIFAGWSTDPNATANGIAAGSRFTVSSVAGGAELVDGKTVITLYAVWTPKVVIPESAFQRQSIAYTGEPIAYDTSGITVGEAAVTGFYCEYYTDYNYTEKLDGAPTDVGSYYVLINRPEDETYAAFSFKTSLTITGKRMSVNQSPVSVYYDGQPHTITVTVTEPVDGYTIRYGTRNNQYTLDEPPTFTDVCSYEYIYFQVTAPGYETTKNSAYISVRKATPVLNFEEETVSKTTGDDAFTVALSKPDYVTGVSYTSSEPSVAQVDALTGEVTIVGAGTTVVTATVEGTDNYESASDSYTLNVAFGEVAVLPGASEVKGAEGVDADVINTLSDTTAAGLETDAAEVTVSETVTADRFNGLLPAEAADATDADAITILVAPYLDITVKGYNAVEKTLELDIVAMYQLKATSAESTAAIREQGDDGVTDAEVNTVTLPDTKNTLDTAGTPVTITVPLPDGFVGNADFPLFVKHEKTANLTYVYKADVEESGKTFTASFVNPNGFSAFTLSAETAASIIGENGEKAYYATLADAVKAVEDGQSILLEADCTETVTIQRDVSFTLNLNGKSFTGDLQAGSNTTIQKTENQDGTISYAFDYTAPAGGATTYAITVSSAANGKVTVSPSRASKDTKVTITVKPDEGYVLDSLTVTDKDGKTVSLTKVSDTEYTFTMPASAVTVKAAFVDEGLPFTDVAGHWALDAIEYVYDAGMMNGVTTTKFGPETELNRAMIVTILYRLETDPTYSATLFPDVASDAYYADATAWASANGIVTGYTDGTFGPEDSITREQLAAILYRYASYKGYDVTGAADLSGYTDAENISTYAVDAMAWANAEGLITGVTATTLNPRGTATRAQVATMLMRFCENIVQ